MKKSILIFICVLVLISIIFTACATKNKTEDASGADVSSTEGLEAADNAEFGFETETVTDEDGNKVTTEVAVVYKKDKKGNVYAQKIDESGKEVTDKKGNPVTVKTEQTTTKKQTTTKPITSNSTQITTTEKATATTKKGVDLTKDSQTTKFDGSEVVPKTSEKGTPVSFSAADQQIISNMLEVPYLYLNSYENTDGVPIQSATYTAVWMAQHNGGSDGIYPASPVVLNLFKFYGQTVVNFKTKCNSIEDSPILYDKSNDTFTVSSYPEKKQSVTITDIEDLGNNNFYKITGDVSGAKGVSKVVAIVQKNRLDPTLGFSIKALKWS